MDELEALQAIQEELRQIYNGQIDVESCLNRIEEILRLKPTPPSADAPLASSPPTVAWEMPWDEWRLQVGLAWEDFKNRLDRLEAASRPASSLGFQVWFKCPHCGESAPIPVGPNPSGPPSEPSPPANQTVGGTLPPMTSAGNMEAPCN